MPRGFRVLGSAFLAFLSGCQGRAPLPREIADSGLETAPQVVTRAAAVLFWLPAADTLAADSAAMGAAFLSHASTELRDLFGDSDIALFVTRSTRLYVQADGAPRRMVSLAGLDYPWGVVFVEPGYAEQIVTGPVVELRDLATDYFGLDDSDGRSPIAHCPIERGCADDIPIPNRDPLLDGQWAMGNLQIVFLRDFHSRNAGIPAAMIPKASSVCRAGCRRIVLPTMAAALRMKRTGVSG